MSRTCRPWLRCPIRNIRARSRSTTTTCRSSAWPPSRRGKKTAALTADDLPAIKDVLLKWKANARLVGEVTASQTALATGEADILVGGGEWVTAVLAAENPALDFSIPEEGGILWSQSLAMFADSENKDLALKFIQYIMSPEGQARLATSSCYWGMPANRKAALTDAQKAVLRFDEQPEFLERASALPRARRGPRQEDAGPLDRRPAGPVIAGATADAARALSEAMAAGQAMQRWTPWAYVGPGAGVDGGVLRSAIAGDGLDEPDRARRRRRR